MLINGEIAHPVVDCVAVIVVQETLPWSNPARRSCRGAPFVCDCTPFRRNVPVGNRTVECRERITVRRHETKEGRLVC